MTDRKHWIAMLAKLVCPTDAVGAARSLASMLPMLPDFPDGAFTLASLDYVALQCRRLPSYAELRAALGEWWKLNRPEPLAIAAPTEDRSATGEWNRVGAFLEKDWDNAQGVRTLLAKCDGSAMLTRFLAGLVARHAPQHLAIVPPEFWPDWAHAA